MPLVVKDRVKETTTSTGTGTITLAGAVAGFQSFSVIGYGSTTYYAIVGTTEWEVGVGTYTSSGTTLSRDTILESSNSGSAVDFSAGEKEVFVTYPAKKSSVTYTSVKTGAYTAGFSEGVLTNTTSSAFTVTLPASPFVGAQVIVVDTTGTWGTNNLTIGRNGATIAGVAEDLVCDISNVSVQLVYSGTTWEVYSQLGAFSGDAVTINGVQTLTNKTISYADNTLTGVVGLTATQTLTNKTISYADNTLTGVVGTTDTQTLTNKTLTDPAITGTIVEDVFTITDGAGFAIDPRNGSVQFITLGASRTPVASNFNNGDAVTMMIADGTAYTITWTTVGVVWTGGSPPTLATSGYTVVQLWKAGGTIYGAHVGNVA
jgi:hypothetical protein